MPESSALPRHATAVIVGGGIVGASVAYHLTLRGVTDVIVLERKTLTSGTTWHAAGLVGQLRATENLTRLAQYTTHLYTDLEKISGQATGFKQSGSISVANHPERFEELLRTASMARSFGLVVETLTPDQIKEKWPIIEHQDLLGGVWLPKDGRTNPVDTAQALMRAAKNNGAQLFEHTRVETILVNDQATAYGVVVNIQGRELEMSADIVINCAGMWARELAANIGVNVPLHAAEHFYIVSEPIAGLTNDLPVLRDPDNYSYFKEDAGKLLVGWFEPIAKPWGEKGIPESFSFSSLPDDLAHIEPLLAASIKRVPLLANVGIQLFFNGPESFTPDDRYLLGANPEVKNLFVAAGFNSIGIQSAGGAGKVLADWVVDGHPPMDLWDVDVRRMMPFQRNRSYLYDRTRETLGLLYAMHWPFRQYESARGVRRSALHTTLAEHGACFGEVAGYERANWFAPTPASACYEYSYKRQNWFAYSAAEHLAVRNNVGLFDLSSFAKFILEGRDALQVINQLCANEMDKPVGRVTYTQCLNEHGGIEADVTVTRYGKERFFIVSTCATQMRDFHWFKQHIPSQAHAHLIDVSSGYSVLALMGPNARKVLSELTPTDLSNQAFPYASVQCIELGYALVWAHRISYVGELGYELYIPTEFTHNVFTALWKVAEPLGVKLAGYHALNSLRMEKAYRHYGHDITDHDTPLEAGLGFAIAWNKEQGFIGKAALQEQRQQGLTRRLLQFSLDADTPLIYHNEPIWRDGVIVGSISSGMFGHYVNQSLGLGYVNNQQGLADTNWCLEAEYAIEIAGVQYPASASLHGCYDVCHQRLRG